MTDTGWEKWADDAPMQEDVGRDMAEACIKVLQRKPDVPFRFRTHGNTLVAAVRGEDGTIWAWRCNIREERMIYAD